MKEIKAYLSNQKDIYTMLMLQELQAENTDLGRVEKWITKARVLGQELDQLNKQK